MTKTYRVVTAPYRSDLEAEVNKWLGFGYEPLGGATLSSGLYIQAIWKVQP